MAVVSTNIKIEPELKKESQALFESMGMSLSTAVNIFLRQAVREQAIPFRIGTPTPNAVTLQAMENAENDADLFGPFDTVADMMEALNA